MNGYAPIHVYRGLYRFNGVAWEPVTNRPGHIVQIVLPDYLYTYDARAEYPELSQHLGAPYWAGLWQHIGNGWRLHRSWDSWS